MSLKDLVIRRKGKPKPSPANVIISTLRRFGVSAPVTTAAAITEALRAEGYGFNSSTAKPSQRE